MLVLIDCFDLPTSSSISSSIGEGKKKKRDWHLSSNFLSVIFPEFDI